MNIKNHNRKIAIYCRVSTGMQTTDRQKTELLKYADIHGLTIDDDMIFIDIISGYTKSSDRPEYSKLMDLVDRGYISMILFSELTRLGRNSNELLVEIEKLQSKDVTMYFQKQDLTVNNSKNDLGTKILLNVLAVTAAYEIELFTQRSLSGKIQKLSQGGGDSDSRTFGYMNDDAKRICINPEESVLVVRIFTLYANGVSSIKISEILNSENIPTKTKSVVEAAKANRLKKGIEEKRYSLDVENIKWRPSTITRMLNNDLYIGHRHIILHEPDPTNKIPTKKRTERTVAFEYDIQDENLRIIPQDLWIRVQEQLAKAPYNKDNSRKHVTLLNKLLKCGECGSNYSVSLGSEYRVYRCYGTISRPDKPKVCDVGAQMLMKRVDGLVVFLSMGILIAKNTISNNKRILKELQSEIDQEKFILNSKKEELEKYANDYKKQMRFYSLTFEEGDKDLLDEINDIKSDYKKKAAALQSNISTIEKKIGQLLTKVENIEAISKNISVLIKNNEQISLLRENRSLMDELINQYVESIIVYRFTKIWSLLIIKYTTGDEIWGTIKTARYKKNEILFDENIHHFGPQYQSMIIRNNLQAFTYDAQNKKVIFNGDISGKYDFLEPQRSYNYEELFQLFSKNGEIGSFPEYEFEIEE